MPAERVVGMREDGVSDIVYLNLVLSGVVDVVPLNEHLVGTAESSAIKTLLIYIYSLPLHTA